MHKRLSFCKKMRIIRFPRKIRRELGEEKETIPWENTLAPMASAARPMSNLTADHAYKVGRLVWYYGERKRQAGRQCPARVVIGKDTRRSSYMFEYSLVGGLVASGADAYLMHVTTTPSVAYIAQWTPSTAAS